MLSFNLECLFSARGIERPYSFLVNAGFSPNIATKLVNSKNRNIHLDHLERLCKVLVCEPSDLFFWSPNKDESIKDNHPLHKLEKVVNIDLKESVADIPFSELKKRSI